MLERFDRYGVPIDFLERNSLRLYFGRDWPADIYDALERAFDDKYFDVYIDFFGSIEKQSTGLYFGDAQIAATDNVSHGTLLATSGDIYIYVTDDNDIFYICAREDFLRSLLRDLGDSGIMTDTNRLSLSPHLLRAGVLEFYEHFRRYNIEIA